MKMMSCSDTDFVDFIDVSTLVFDFNFNIYRNALNGNMKQD